MLKQALYLLYNNFSQNASVFVEFFVKNHSFLFTIFAYKYNLYNQDIIILYNIHNNLSTIKTVQTRAEVFVNVV